MALGVHVLGSLLAAWVCGRAERVHHEFHQEIMQRLIGRLTDAAVQPRLTRFVFDEVLRMPRAEFLAGATLAAEVVCDAISEAAAPSRLRNDQHLLQLHNEGLLEPTLFSAISQKIVHRRERLKQGCGPNVHLESDVELAGPAWLQHTRLVIGAQRATFDSRGKTRLDLGSHLVLCGESLDSDPPPLDTDLAHRLGCVVQLTVLFDRRAPLTAGTPEGMFPHLPQNATPQSFTFEAAVAGRSGSDARVSADDLVFRVVDVNSLARGCIEFWSGAEVVPPTRLFFPARAEEKL
jgi:hypothetical protein